MFFSTSSSDPFAGAIDYLIQRVCAEASYDVEVIRHLKPAQDRSESLGTVRALEKRETCRARSCHSALVQLDRSS